MSAITSDRSFQATGFHASLFIRAVNVKLNSSRSLHLMSCSDQGHRAWPRKVRVTLLTNVPCRGFQ